MKKIIKNIATLGIIGYLPAPGTCATLATIPLVYCLQSFFGCGIAYVVATSLTTIFSFFIIKQSLHIFNQGSDPQQIVLDELVGCLIAFMCIPLSLNTLSIGLILFRFLDIFKPWPIRLIERAPGAWGNMGDDVLAGIVTNLILWFVA